MKLPVHRIIPFSNVEGIGNRTSIFVQAVMPIVCIAIIRRPFPWYQKRSITIAWMKWLK